MTYVYIPTPLCHMSSRVDANETLLHEKKVDNYENREPLSCPQVIREYTGVHMIVKDDSAIRSAAISARAGAVDEGPPPRYASQQPMKPTETDPLMKLLILGAGAVVVCMFVTSRCGQSSYRGTSSYKKSVENLLGHVR